MLTPPSSGVAPKPKRPAVLPSGDLGLVHENEADYELVSPAQVFGDTTNLIPAAQNMKGARLFISAKYFTQALPLSEQEAPLVDSLDTETGRGYGRIMGTKVGIRPAQVDGKVTKVGPGYITIQGADGTKTKQEIYHYFPGQRKTFLHDIPMVKAGDQVFAGQPIARSNFTTPEGDIAVGRNLRVAFMAAPGGSSFEDAIAVSQGAANKLTSTHMYGYSVDHRNGLESNKDKFIQLFPNKFTNAQLDKLDEFGMAKPGVRLEKNDPVMLAMRPRMLSSRDAALGALGKVLRASYDDQSVLWEKGSPGVVSDAVKTRTGLRVNVVNKSALAPGDKISARQGAKGVIGQIIPDDQMPHDARGNPIDVIINPAALIGRVNPAMVFEAMLGKVADKTGERIIIPTFSEKETLAFVKQKLADAGLTDREDLFDPVKGRALPGVLTGKQYFMKLEHQAEGKLSAREEGGSDINEQPTKGGKEGAKRLGGLMNTALLSHGATAVLRDAHIYRGSSNPDAWRAIRSGRPLPAPKVPFVYDKYLAILRGAGINVQEGSDRVSITAMTDKDVDQLHPQEVLTSDTITEDTGEPIKGGLFDFGIFGGPEQKGWGVINLHEPLPNPIMENSTRALLGITANKMRGIVAGQEQLAGMTGPRALEKALSQIDLDHEEREAINTIRQGRKTKRNEAIKKLRAIRGLKEAGLEPVDLLVTKVPVIPPTFRPAVKMGDMTVVSDANFLYKDLLEARDSLRTNKARLPDEMLGDERLAVYDAIRAIQGLGDPIHPEHREKQVKGFLKLLTGAGSGPKFGFFTSKVLGHPVNTVGRSVIIPDAQLNMDQIGLPEKMAWGMYAPHVVGRMVKDGMMATRAAEEVEAHSDTAKRYLLDEMRDRPVMYSRDPALHKFSIMGAEPVLVAGDAIRISPLVVKPFGADFDGDQMNVHLPVSQDAIKDIREKMLPSKNLFSISSREVHYTPSQEFILGLYNATQSLKGKHRVYFNTKQEAMEAYQEGRISIDTPIVILRR